MGQDGQKDNPEEKQGKNVGQLATFHQVAPSLTQNGQNANLDTETQLQSANVPFSRQMLSIQPEKVQQLPVSGRDSVYSVVPAGPARTFNPPLTVGASPDSSGGKAAIVEVILDKAAGKDVVGTSSDYSGGGHPCIGEPLSKLWADMEDALSESHTKAVNLHNDLQRSRDETPEVVHE